MKEIELLEKLVAVQEQHIELLMQDYRSLQNCYKDLEKVKNQRIKDLNGAIDYYQDRVSILEKKNVELKKQIEELQKRFLIEMLKDK